MDNPNENFIEEKPRESYEVPQKNSPEPSESPPTEDIIPKENQKAPTEKVNFPLKEHFKEAWKRMTKNILTLLLITIVSFFFLFLIGIIGFFVTTSFFSKLYNLDSITTGVSIFSRANMIRILVTLVILSLITIAVNTIRSASYIYTVSEDYKIKMRAALKRGFGTFLSLVLLAVISGFLIIGGLFLLIIPAFIIGSFISLSAYIVVIEKKGAFKAVTRSIKLVSTHFGLVFGRFAFIYLVTFISGIALNYLIESDKVITAVGFIIGLLYGLFVAWFNIAYGVKLYEYLKSVYKEDEKHKTFWVWLLSIIGWIAGGLLIYYFITVINPRNMIEQANKAKEARQQMQMHMDIQKENQESYEDMEIIETPEATESTKNQDMSEESPFDRL